MSRGRRYKMQSPLKIQGTAKMWRTNCPGRARHGHRLRATPKTRHRDTGSERLAGGRPGRAPGTRTGHTDAGPGARGRRRCAALAGRSENRKPRSHGLPPTAVGTKSPRWGWPWTPSARDVVRGRAVTAAVRSETARPRRSCRSSGQGVGGVGVGVRGASAPRAQAPSPCLLGA